MYSSDDYGEDGAGEFRKLAAVSGVCIDVDRILPVENNTEEYQAVAETLAFNSTAEIVVGFALAQTMRSFFQQLDMLDSTTTFTWIASDAWSQSKTIQETYADILVGSFSVHPRVLLYQNFSTYYSMLTPSNNLRDPWFGDYCNQTLNGNCTDTTSFSDSPVQKRNPATSLVIDAVYSIAHGLDSFLNDSCDQPVVWNKTDRSCAGQTRELNGPVLLEYISAVNFTSPTQAQVFFDGSGDGNPVYSVSNLQKNESGLENIVVAVWSKENGLVFNDRKSSLQFGVTKQGQILSERQSERTSCQEGSAAPPAAHSVHHAQESCTLTSNRTSCEECGQYMWGNNPLNGSTSCVPIDMIYLSSGDPWGIALLTIQSIGIVLLIVISLGLGVFWSNKVIKSFGREQMIFLMIGLVLCFVLPVVYVIKPSTAVCAIRQLGLWLALTLIFAALLIKLIRITRIFFSPTAGTKRKCISPWQQVLFTWIVVFGQLVIVSISLVVVVPEADFIQLSNSTYPNGLPTLAVI